MKKVRFKVLGATMVMALLLFFDTAGVGAVPITKVLEENMRITPPGTIASQRWNNIPEFMKGTTVTLNEYGEVLEGTLSSTQELLCVAGGTIYYRYYHNGSMVPTRLLLFQSGTKVVFNEKGEVTKGTLAAGGSEAIPISPSNYIDVKVGSEVSFHGNGMLASCTFKFPTYIRPVGWQQNLTAGYTNKFAGPGFIEIKDETTVELNEKGELLKGTLNKDAKLPSPNGIKVYEAGTTVEFDDKGVVVKATK